MKVFNAVVAVLLVMFTAVITPAVAFADPITIVNGGFENTAINSPPGLPWQWQLATNGGQVMVNTSYGIDPKRVEPYTDGGTRFAYLLPGSPYENGNPATLTILYQTLNAEKDDAIRGFACFISDETQGRYNALDPDPNDWAKIVIRRVSDGQEVTLYYMDVNTAGFNTKTDWTEWTHTFSQAGEYVLEAQIANVKDSARQSVLCIDAITTFTLGAPPVADAGGPYSVTEGGGTVTLHGEGSSPNGAVTFAWDLDNNGTFETPGQDVVFRATGLDGPATVYVTLKVSDPVTSTTDTATINVINVVPAIIVNPSQQTVTAGAPAHFVITLQDPGPNDGWKLKVDFRDGTPEEERTISAAGDYVIGDHVYSSAGTYEPRFDIKDKDSPYTGDIKTVVVNVTGEVPLPEFTKLIRLPDTNLELKPTDMGPNTYDGGDIYVNENTPITLEIYIVDKVGNGISVFPAGALPAGAAVSQAGATGTQYEYKSTFTWTPTYCQSGEYNIQIRAYHGAFGTAPEGVSSSLLYFDIIVENVNRPPNITNTGGPYIINQGDGVTLTALATDADAECGETLTYLWDFKGDGTDEITTSQPVSTVTAAQLAAFGLAPGTVYTLKLTVKDASGATAQASTTILITPRYTLSISRQGSGGIVLVDGVQVTLPYNASYLAGTSVQLAANPDGDWVFLKWEGDLTGNANPATILMNGNKSVTAVFQDKKLLFILTVNITGNGSVTREPNLAGYPEGTEVTLTAVPAAGNHFVEWGGAASGDDPEITLVMNAAKTVTATFAINTYTINASAGTGGSINPSGAVTVNHGANQAFQIVANTGYRVTDVKVDGVSKGVLTTYTFENVTSAHSIAAFFTVNTFTISASAGAHGSISPAGETTVNYGDDPVYTITADAGYHILDVVVDGVSKGAISTYTFSDVSTNHTISATFAPDFLTITASASENGTISPSGSVQVAYGASKSFTITANATYRVKDVLVDGVSAGAVTSYIFTNVIVNHTIAASFEKAESYFDAFLIKHLHINWDSKKSGSYGDDDKYNDCRDKWQDYLGYKDKYGENSKKAVEKFNEYLKCWQKHFGKEKAVENKDCNSALDKYNDYLKYLSKYGENNKKTQDKYNEYLTYKVKCETKCQRPSPPVKNTKADFHVNGRIKLPAGITMDNLQRSAEVTLVISNPNGTIIDTVVFNKGNTKDDATWIYSGNDPLNGPGLDVEKMTIWWAPLKGNWAGYAGFHISGDLQMPAGIDGSSTPVVTLIIRIPHTQGFNVVGQATVECKVSGQNCTWQYNAHLGWPQFPYDLDEDED